VTIDRVFVDDSARERQFGHLPIVDFLLHGAGGQKAVDVARLRLTEAVDTEDGLHVIRGVPRGVEQHHTVGADHVHTKSTSTSRHQEQLRPGKNMCLKSGCQKHVQHCKCLLHVAGIVELFDEVESVLDTGLAVNAEVVDATDIAAWKTTVELFSLFVRCIRHFLEEEFDEIQ
jgi:hypothetical protein